MKQRCRLGKILLFRLAGLETFQLETFQVPVLSEYKVSNGNQLNSQEEREASQTEACRANRAADGVRGFN